jgi:hypothetical protein
MTVGDTQAFAVAGTDADGNTVSNLGVITWSGGEGIGTIDPDTGLFTADTIGTGMVTATSSRGGVSNITGDINVYSSAIKGDLNGDGVVDLDDAIIVLRVLSGAEETQIRLDYAVAEVDVNGNQRVDHAELLFIMREMATNP